jgi:Mrp family chromosome partitioning ATPase
LLDQSGNLGSAARGRDSSALFDPEHYEPFVIMVTSGAPREGKTTTTASLAAVFAEAGSSVLVVNCDFRRPTIHQLFGVEDEPRRVHDTVIPGVKLITNVLSDPNPNPAQVVAAQRHVIAAAHGRFDVILLDTAPLLSANDAVELVGSADLVVLAARAELSTSDDATRATDLLTRLDAPLGGVVLAMKAHVASNYYYYYGPGAQRPQGRGAAAHPPASSFEPTAASGNGANGTSKQNDLFGDEKSGPADMPQRD